MENIRRIHVISNLGRHICTAMIFLVPVFSALFWVYFNRLIPYMNTEMFKGLLPIVPDHDISAMARFIGFIVSLLHNVVIIYGLFKLRRLFSLYERGIIFSKKNVACFRDIGWSFIVFVAATTVSNALLSVVLTFANPPGQRMLTVGFSSRDLTTLCLGLAVLLISWAMDEGRRIAEEQEQFI